MTTRKKRTTANSTKGASSSLDEEPNLSTLLTQGEALSESGAAHEAELAKLRREAEELARTKKRLLAIQHEAEIQKQKVEIASLKEELRALKAKQSLSFNQPSPEYTVPNQSTFNERTEFSPSPSAHHFQPQPLREPFRVRSFAPGRSYHPHEILGSQTHLVSRNSDHSMATNVQASPTTQILGPI
jgi:hypothetical protein